MKAINLPCFVGGIIVMNSNIQKRKKRKDRQTRETNIRLCTGIYPPGYRWVTREGKEGAREFNSAYSYLHCILPPLSLLSQTTISTPFIFIPAALEQHRYPTCFFPAHSLILLILLFHTL